MRAHEVDLITLIQGSKQFQVPLYQRPYSWTNTQLEQLWDDILAEADRLRDGYGGSGHFIGSVVLAPSPVLQAGSMSRWLVVDGQQRLTTLMVLLAAIRDHIRSGDPQTANRINVEYLINQFETGDDRLRLLPTQADRDAFRACVLGLPGKNAAGGVGDAYRRYRANLLAFDDPDDEHDVARVERVVRTRLRLVQITSDQGDNVHRIFQSLNNTGLTLSQADLLRNHLFMLLPSMAEEVYNDVWLSMQQTLGGDLELLIWLDMVLRGHDQIKQTEIFRAQADRLHPYEGDEYQITTEIREFARRTIHLLLLLHPDTEQDEAVRRMLTRLREWGGQGLYPAAMLLLDCREQGRLTSAGVAEGLLVLESFLVRRMIDGIPTNNLNRILNAVPREISDAKDVVAALRDFLSGTRRFWPGDVAIRQAVRTKPFYWSGRGPQRSYVLRRIEEDYDAAVPVDWARTKTSIEHVMPQTLTDAWRVELAPEAEAEELSVAELHETLVHTVGNLTLTAFNGPMASLPFVAKKEILRKGALAMNDEVLAAERWGAAEIRSRADRLADRIIAIWPGPKRTESAGVGRDWTRLHQALALMPAGTWTTYGDLAELIGSHPVPVGVHLATQQVRGAWRALTVDGTPSPQFRWTDPERSGSQRAVLEDDGVVFDSAGRAITEQRLSGAELADLVGLDVPTETPDLTSSSPKDPYDRFMHLLEEEQNPATATGVQQLLDRWEILGGVLSFGRADETSCFPVLDHPTGQIWPVAIYPRTGSVEVVFQHLARRIPFDNPSVRRELLDRLNRVDGIRLSEAKLSMRPSFPIDVLGRPGAPERVGEVFDWFVEVCIAADAAPRLAGTSGPEQAL